MVRDRATVVQKKTGRPVQFEITEQTRASLEVWLRILRGTGSQYLFPSRLHARPHLSTRQYIISKLECTVRYLWMEVDDALHIAEQIELSSSNPPIPGGRLRANKLEFPENQVEDPLPMPGRILTRLAVSPSRLRRKVLEF